MKSWREGGREGRKEGRKEGGRKGGRERRKGEELEGGSRLTSFDYHRDSHTPPVEWPQH